MAGRADITRDAILDMALALHAENWCVRLVHEDESEKDEPRVIDCYYRPQTLLHPRTIRFLRGRNMDGYHVYGRPNTTQYILVDDLCEDAIDTMHADNINTPVVVMTSKGNYQAWVKVSKEPITNAEATACARVFAKRYDTDICAANAMQLGRLPQTTNQKEMHRQSNGKPPWTRLHKPFMRYIAPAYATHILDDARTWLRDNPPFCPSTRRGGGLNLDIPAFLTPDEATLVYYDAVDYLIDTFGRQGFTKPGGTIDRSRLDYNVVRHLQHLDFTKDECIAVLMAGSDKAQERGVDYVIKTVSKLYPKGP